MSDIFAEVSVRVTPDITGFAKALNEDLKAELKKVKKPIIPVGVGLERGALTKLRREVDSVIAKVKPKPIRVKIIVDKPTKAALTGAVPKTATASAGAAAAAAPAVLSTEGLAATAALTTALEGLSKKLDEVAIKTTRTSQASKEAAKAALEDAEAATALTKEQQKEVDLKERLVVVDELLKKKEIDLATARAASAEALKISNAASRLGLTDLSNAAKESRLTGLGLVDTLKQQERQANRTARQFDNVKKGALSTSLSFAGVRGATLAASKSFLAGAATIGVFAKLIKSSADLEQQLSVFRATAGATAGEMERVETEARKLGADLTLPSVTASDAAEAMVELAKAGLSVEDSIAAARGVLQLATAAAISNEEATRLAANALNAFGLAGKDAVRVADTLANSANLAQGSIADVGIAFQQAASAGRTVGLSFEDTSLFLTELAQNGLRGSDAGTSLRTALIRLIHPSKEAQEAINKLGVEIRDAQGNLRPDVFIQLAEATKNLTPAQRDATIALIGGQDAFRALSILGRQSIGEFIRLRRALREQGTAAELAAARSAGLHGAIDALGSSLETVGTTLGSKIGPGLAGFTRNLASGVNQLAASQTVADTASGALLSVSSAFDAIGASAQFAAPAVLGITNALLGVTNFVGLPQILGFVVAFKALPAVTKRAGDAIDNVQKRIAKFEKASELSIRSTAGLKAALKSVVTSFNFYAIAAGVAAAGLVFLLTRQTAVEKATKNLASATEELASAESDLDAARRDSTISGHSVNQEIENLATARSQAAAARQRAAALGATASDFARRKAALAVAIALDNVAIAEQHLNDARDEAATAAEALDAAEARRTTAIREEAKALNDLIEANRRLALSQNSRARGGRGRGPGPPSQADVAAGRQKALQDAIRRTAEEVKKEALEERNSADASVRELAKRKLAWANLVQFIGKPLSPTEIDIVFNSKSILQGLRTLQRRFREDGNKAGVLYIESLITGMGLLPNAISDAMDAGARRARLSAFEGGKTLGKDVVDGAKSELSGLTAALEDAVRDASRAATRLSLARGTGVGLSGQLSIAQQRLANARRAVANARRILGKGESPQRREDFDAAVAEQEAAFNEVQSIQDEIASNTKQALEDAKERASDLTQAFIDSFEKREQFLKNKITKAGLTPQLADDKAATEALLAFYIKEREEIKRRIKQMKLHGDALKIARDAIRALNQTIFETRNEINSIQQQQNERIKQKLDLRIQIAEVNENVAAQIRLHRAKLKQIQKELAELKNQHKKNTVEWLELKLAEAQEIKAINDLRKTNDEKNNANAQLAFSFLTTQAGFAANLLGNLLPMGAIGGTVGNTSATVTGPSSSGSGPFQLPREQASGLTMPNPKFKGPQSGLGEAHRVTEANAAGGFTASQAAMLIALTQQVVRLLQHLNGNSKHPEQKKATKINNAQFDGVK